MDENGKTFFGHVETKRYGQVQFIWKHILIRTFFVLSDAAVFYRHNLRTNLRFEAFFCDFKIITRDPTIFQQKFINFFEIFLWPVAATTHVSHITFLCVFVDACTPPCVKHGSNGASMNRCCTLSANRRLAALAMVAALVAAAVAASAVPPVAQNFLHTQHVTR